MKKLSLIFVLVLFIINCYSVPKVLTGIEVLEQSNFKILEGKRVGLITNPTGINSKFESTIDILFRQKNFKLVALFGPEHGVRGDYAAGDKVENYVDSKTGLTVYSLYGKTHKPTKEMLKDIDVLVYDIQDIGARSYTYISTMGVSMEAAAENNIEFVVLDRPNPLTGLKFEGSLVRDGFFSFVSKFPIPYVYGLTCGELAEMINNEGWLKDGIKCKLTVIKMKGWKREMTFAETGLPWVLTSPHIPHYYSAAYYSTTGILGELGVISEGVGYTLPFQLLGAEWIDAYKIAEAMNNLNLPGVHFRPITFKPFYHIYTGKTLHGVQIYLLDEIKANLTSIQFYFLQELKKLYPDKDIFTEAKPNRISMFDKVCGDSKIRELFTKNYKYDDIKPIWEKEANDFKKKAQKYFLY